MLSFWIRIWLEDLPSILVLVWSWSGTKVLLGILVLPPGNSMKIINFLYLEYQIHLVDNYWLFFLEAIFSTSIICLKNFLETILELVFQMFPDVSRWHESQIQSKILKLFFVPKSWFELLNLGVDKWGLNLISACACNLYHEQIQWSLSAESGIFLP